jgi:protocatechuate 3,4-dioxygenase, alpha subunit
MPVATPSQTVGPFYKIGLDWLSTTDLAATATKGERITVSGQLLDADRQPIPDAVLELWQANADGRYAHAEDTQAKPLDPGFHGYGRVGTDTEGRFRFATIKPGQVPGLGNTLQAPHIVVALFMRGVLRHLYTRIYFSDEAANGSDPVLALVEDSARRATLVAKRLGTQAEYRWDIIVQGAGETVFFDC